MTSAQPSVAGVMGPASSALARVYGGALLGLLDDTEAAEAAEQLDALASIVVSTEGAEELLRSAKMSVSERVAMADRVFEGRVGEIISRTMGVMARHGRLWILRALAREFRGQFDARRNVVRVDVTTSRALRDEERDEIAAALGEALAAEVAVHESVDESIVGGLVVRIGDDVYDASVARDLKLIARKFGERIGGR